MATAYSLEGILDLNPSDFVSGADEAAGASSDVGAATGEMSESLWDVKPAGVAAGGALAGLGTAAQSLLDDTRDMRESLGRTSETMGISSDEASELAQSMSNATFPLEDVTASMDDLSRMGVTSAEDMRDLALAADNIADATGTSASAITSEFAPAVNALDGDLSALIENQDAFTLAARNTTLSIEDIGRTISRLDYSQLEEMGLKSQEVTGLIAKFGEESGYTGRQLESNFNQAVEAADGDLGALQEELGLSDNALDEWNQTLEDSAGVTDRHAEAANESYSAMDDLRAGFEDAKLAAAGYLEPISAVAPAAQAAGIGMMTLSTVNLSAVVPSLGAVTAAALPLLPLIAGLGIAMAGAAVIWKRDIGGIQGKTETAVDVITDGLGRLVEGVEWAIDTASFIMFEWNPQDTVDEKISGITDRVDDLTELMPGSVGEATAMASDVFRRWHPAGIIWDKRDEILGALPTAADFAQAGRDMMEGWAEGIREKAPDPIGAISGVGKGISSRLPSSDAEEGELSNLSAQSRALPETMAAEIVANTDSVERASDRLAAAASPDPTVAMETGGRRTRSRAPARAESGISIDRLQQALAGMRFEMDLGLDDREFGRVIEDRAEAVFVRGSTGAGGRGI